MRSLGLAVVAVAAVISGLADPPRLTSAPGDLALRVSRWLDVRSGELRGPDIIVVSSGKIAAILSPSTFDDRSAASTIDLGDTTLLPGLVDAHVHLQIGGEPAANAIQALRAGFTTVVDLGATSDVVIRLRDAIAAGSAEGPRILAAGRWVGTKNGVCEFGGIGVTGGPEAFRARVRENIAAGADLTKVCVSGWTADAFAKPDAYEIADDALGAVVAESRESKRLVIAHAIGLGSVKASIRAGVNGLAHAAFLDAATARQLRDRGVFLVPTLTSLVAGAPGAPGAALRATVGLAYRDGVRIVFGTDGGVLPHGQNATEFAELVEAGLPPIEAIRAATMNAVVALRLSDVGSIEVGRIADLIAIDGDPLADIRALSRVAFVMQNGRVVRGP
jgi:imidazolonepropionase-like amidohydrolase